MSRFFHLATLITASFLASCYPKTEAEQKITGAHLDSLYQQIGVYKNPYNLHPTLQKACHESIKANYISKLSNPSEWKVSRELATMEITNYFLHDYQPRISQRLGYDTSNTLAFLTNYVGEDAIGIETTKGYVCLIQIVDRHMYFKAALSAENFTEIWQVMILTPKAWRKKA